MDTPLWIDLRKVAGANIHALDPITDAVFIYALTRNGVPWYVGSTTNPTTRLLAHLTLQTKDTNVILMEMQARGEPVGMEILDLTTRSDRYTVEARWINETTGVVNTSRYPDHYRRWQECPHCFRAMSTGTLAVDPRPN